MTLFPLVLTMYMLRIHHFAFDILSFSKYFSSTKVCFFFWLLVKTLTQWSGQPLAWSLWCIYVCVVKCYINTTICKASLGKVFLKHFYIQYMKFSLYPHNKLNPLTKKRKKLVLSSPSSEYSAWTKLLDGLPVSQCTYVQTERLKVMFVTINLLGFVFDRVEPVLSSLLLSLSNGFIL